MICANETFQCCHVTSSLRFAVKSTLKNRNLQPYFVFLVPDNIWQARVLKAPDSIIIPLWHSRTLEKC